MEVIIKEDYDALCQESAEIILRTLRKTPDLSLGLASGRTPLGVYKKLIQFYKQGRIDFSKVRIFNLDEFVGLGGRDSGSFSSFLRGNFLDHINIPEENIFLLDGRKTDLFTYTKEYEREIFRAGGIQLQILGVGVNGHIGFNEPGSSLGSRTRIKTLLPETRRYYQEIFGENIPSFSITLGIGTIMESKKILLLASGEEKSRIVKHALEGPITSEVPASILQMHPDVVCVLDNAAAKELSRKEYWQWIYDNKYLVGEEG
jgi:glucosamine-6-phosphate deaminase